MRPILLAANRQRKMTVILFIMTIVSLLLWLPYVVHTFVPYSVLDRLSFAGIFTLEIIFFSSIPHKLAC